MTKKIFLIALLCLFGVAFNGCQSAIDAQGRMVGLSQIHKAPNKYVYFVGADGKKYRGNKKSTSFYVGGARPVPVSDEEWNNSF